MKKGILLLFLLIYIVNLYAVDCNCCNTTYQSFSFWIGEWEVFDTNGNKIGENTLTIEQDSCVMRENWRSLSGKSKGTSINFYDYQLKQWRQVWVDNNGWVLELFGNKEGNDMILKSKEVLNLQKEKVIHRITWTDNDDGTVRQHWESSKDGEKTWITAFDGLYKRAG